MKLDAFERNVSNGPEPYLLLGLGGTESAAAAQTADSTLHLLKSAVTLSIVTEGICFTAGITGFTQKISGSAGETILANRA